MALPPLATPEQLAGWMQVDVGDLPASAASTLDIVSAIVRAEALNSFSRRTATATFYPVANRGHVSYVDLPIRPVVSVASVTRSGVAQDFELKRDRIHLSGLAPVSVTFTGGYSEVPGDVLGVVLTAAQRVISNPSDLRQETVGSISVTYAAETIGASLSAADKDLLARYRRRAAMVRLE